MNSGFDGSFTVTTTRTARIAADPMRKTLILSAPVTNIVRVSTRAEVGGGGFLLMPGTSPIILKFG